MTDTHQASSQKGGFSLTPLMFETFVCSMAMMSFVALAGPIARIVGLAPWQIGVAMTAAGVAWMVMARVWGGLSDRLGRRVIILRGLFGFAVCYALLALFIHLILGSPAAPLIAFGGLVLGRTLTGAFYAAVPATTAALVADHTPPQKRAGAMATIGAANAAGMVIGPGLAGLAAPYNLSLPLFISAFLPILALAVLWRVLPKDGAHAARKPAPLGLFDRRLRRAMTLGFIAAFSVANAQIVVGFFALDRLGLPPSQAAQAAGTALAIVGVALVCAQIFVRKAGWPPARLIRAGGIIAAFGFAGSAFATEAATLWAAYGVSAFGLGWVYPSISALAANSVEPHEQGGAAGTVASAQGFGVIVGPLVGTALYAANDGAPYILVALMLAVAAAWGGAARPRAA
jgi:MFS family permease